MTPPGAVPFDLVGPLPAGRLAIEASAGTGKTFTLAALATRFIAERGVSASELLIVTFTRAATAELRARLRDRLVEAAVVLKAAGSDRHVAADPLLAHLASADRPRRLARLEQAITEFDAATITTIHGFATQALGVLGTTAGTDPDATLVDDTRDLIDEVCADVLARAATGGHAATALPRFDDLRRAVDAASRTPDLHLVPGPGQEGTDDGQRLRVELVRQALMVMADRRRRAGTLSFDDLLTELRRALVGPGRAAAIEAVRSRFRLALIDEFQDTDPVQWDILSALFAEPEAETALVLVGDPKQAIYAFRGANVHTYIHAVSDLSERGSLETNWRSDGAVLGALEVLLDGVTFGDDRIAFAPVKAATLNRERRLLNRAGAPLPALNLRLALGPDLTRGRKKPFDIPTPAVDAAIAADLVGQIRGVLDEAQIPISWPDRSEGPAECSTRPVRPSDIAVLVRSGREAARMQAALVEQGVPAVLTRGGSVLASPAVEQWRWLLEAVLRPSDPGRARLFALSWFAGRTPDWVATATDADLGELQELLHSWGEVLGTSGVVDFVRRVWSQSGVVARVLARPDGDRDVTDLGHIGEILQSGPAGGVSVAGLLALLDTEMPADADAEVEADVAARRVESEAEAVQIMTVWVAKGLEFPIVCCPTLWRRPVEQAVIYQDPDTGLRTYDVTGGAGWPDSEGGAERKRRAAAEALGENLRLLYVALTRAQHQTMVWWTQAQGSDTTALARVLFARKDGRADPARSHDVGVPLPPDAAATLEALTPLLERAGGTIVAAVHGRAPATTGAWVDPHGSRSGSELTLATLGHTPDRSAHRWSFTAITARADHDHRDPYEHATDDEPDEQPDGQVHYPPAEQAEEERIADPRDESPADQPPAETGPGPGPAGIGHPFGGSAGLAGTGLALLPAGTAFGTLVHSVLEAVDFSADDLDDQLGRAIDGQLSWRAADLVPPGYGGPTERDGRRLLIEGLRATLETPLGPVAAGRRLRDFAPVDRLDELSFELHLGDSRTAPTDADIGRLVLRHLPPHDPLRGWAESLAGGVFGVELAGHLTGSIDAVLRVRDGGVDRFVVVDYKTNRLHPSGRTPEPDDYHPEHMAEAMAEHSYPLQALLYLVALHRYLRWRLPGYEPSAHLGGAAYLFVRGMTGGEVPVSDGKPHGVFAWPVPAALVVELSDLLAGRPPTTRSGAAGSRAADDAVPAAGSAMQLVLEW